MSGLAIAVVAVMFGLAVALRVHGERLRGREANAARYPWGLALVLLACFAIAVAAARYVAYCVSLGGSALLHAIPWICIGGVQ